MQGVHTVMELKLWYVQTSWGRESDTSADCKHYSVLSVNNTDCCSLADMLNQLLTRINSVLSLSTDVPTVASSVLDSLQRAYTYVQKITPVKLNLGEGLSKTALNEFDAAFKKCLESRLEEEEQAREELDKCEQLAGEITHL